MEDHCQIIMLYDVFNGPPQSVVSSESAYDFEAEEQSLSSLFRSKIVLWPQFLRLKITILASFLQILRFRLNIFLLRRRELLHMDVLHDFFFLNEQQDYKDNRTMHGHCNNLMHIPDTDLLPIEDSEIWQMFRESQTHNLSWKV